MTKAKRDSLELKGKKYMNQNHSVTDIISLINKSWMTSFVQVDMNQKAIDQRGWFPLNQNLLIFPWIQATMTANERQSQMDSSSIILPSKESQGIKIESSISCANETIQNHKYTIFSELTSNILSSKSTCDEKPSLNFNTGAASFSLLL